MACLLIIDDDRSFRAGLAETLEDFGHRSLQARAGEEGLAMLRAAPSEGPERIVLIFLDLRMPGIDGLECLRRIRRTEAGADCPVVILTAFADSANTIEAMKLGAFDHLTKPVGRADIEAVLTRALERPSAAPRPAARSEAPPAAGLIGASEPMREVHKRVGLAAASEACVLVTGETGTGKEEVARALHRHGLRSAKPFVAVNCAAIPAELLESELFGHVRGAFTGAVGVRLGKFREADGGTLFLDEIGDMTLPMQAKILRVLQEQVVTPVGGTSGQRVSVRIVAATHRDLIAMVREGAFREDLFYRLNVVPIHLPALRERGPDILLLAEHFLREGAGGTPTKQLLPDACARLLAHAWPGNVRELRNQMQNALVNVRGPHIAASDLTLLRPEPRAAATDAEAVRISLGLTHREAIAELERHLFAHALAQAGGNRAEAARRLGVHRPFLYARLKALGLADETEAPPGSGSE